MVEVSWPAAFGDYEALVDDMDGDIILSTNASKRQASMRDSIRVVELAIPIYFDGEPCRHVGVNEGGYRDRTLMWPFYDDEHFNNIRYSNSGSGRTIGEWVDEVDVNEKTFDDAVNWLRNLAANGVRLGETE